MAASRALRRLLRVLTIEEDQCRLALESALGELRRLERIMLAAQYRARGGRRLVFLSAGSGELADRLAGIEETHAAKRRQLALAPRIEQAEREVEELRQAFLAKRVECRQAETLIRENQAKDEVIAGRRTQQALDDWYLNRLHAAKQAAPSPTTANPESAANPADPQDADSSDTPET